VCKGSSLCKPVDRELSLAKFFVDEVLSTEDAKEIMSAQPRSRRHARTSVDRIAAAIILQRYLDKLRD